MSIRSKAAGLSWLGAAIFGVCFIAVAYAVFLVFRPFVTTLVWAAVLTVVFLPLFRKILRLCRGRRAAASFVTCVLILLLIMLPVTFLATAIVHQSVALFRNVQASIDSMSGDAVSRWQQLQNRPALLWLQAQASRWFRFESAGIESYARQGLSALSKWIVAQGPSLLAGVGDMVFSFLLVFIAMFFLFRDGPLIVEFVSAYDPLPENYQSEIIRKFTDVSYATFYGSILTAIVQGISAGLMFWALRVPSPLFWGAIVSLVSLVPIIGAFLVWVPLFGYFMMIGETTRAFLLLSIGGILVSSIDNVLKPLIIRGRTNMHPLLVFLSVLGGMHAFGFLGVLLGPLAIAVFLSFLNFYHLEFGAVLKKRSVAED